VLLAGREPYDADVRLIRVGVWLSVIALLAIYAWTTVSYFWIQLGGGQPSAEGFFIAFPLLLGVPALAFLWLGIFVAAVVRKGLRLLREP
jgi:hypothetical protein